MAQTPSKKFFVILIAVLVVILIALVIFILNLNRDSASGASPYSAVYLRTGDIYFGELSWFPRLKLKNPWFLQRTVDAENQSQVGVAPLADAFWRPVAEINLNQDEIVFWTRLRSDSPVVPLLKGNDTVPIQNSQP